MFVPVAFQRNKPQKCFLLPLRYLFFQSKKVDTDLVNTHMNDVCKVTITVFLETPKFVSGRWNFAVRRKPLIRIRVRAVVIITLLQQLKTSASAYQYC